MGFISQIFGYILNWLYNIFNNYGIAILVFSILLRIILIPITIKQQKSMKKSAELQKEMIEIQKKYKNNPEKLNQEAIELYKREKMSPFSGCLSSILQIIIILAVFWVVSQPLTYMKKLDSQFIEKYTNEMRENTENQNNYAQIALLNYAENKFQEVEASLQETSTKLEQENVENREELEKKFEDLKKQKEDYDALRINMKFLELDLSKVPQQNLNDWKVYVIPLLYVISSIASIKLTMITQKKKQDTIVQKDEEDKKIDDENKQSEEEDPMEQMEQMNKSMTYMMPIMSVMIAIIAPLGLALYWLASNILMIIERLVINKIMELNDKKEGEING